MNTVIYACQRFIQNILPCEIPCVSSTPECAIYYVHSFVTVVRTFVLSETIQSSREKDDKKSGRPRMLSRSYIWLHRGLTSCFLQWDDLEGVDNTDCLLSQFQFFFHFCGIPRIPSVY